MLEPKQLHSKLSRQRKEVVWHCTTLLAEREIRKNICSYERYNTIGSIIDLIANTNIPPLNELKRKKMYGTFHTAVSLSEDVDFIPVETFVSRCILITVDSRDFICEVGKWFRTQLINLITLRNVVLFNITVFYDNDT